MFPQSPDDMLGVPSPPDIIQGFGFSVAKQDTTGVDSALAQSKAVVDALREQLNQYAVNQIASSAVNSDVLRGVIAQNINNSLVDASQSLAQLQQPIHAAIVSPMSSVLETTIPMGVVPPTMETIGTSPVCVSVLFHAKSGNYGPAIEYYLANGGNLGLPLSQRQLEARQYLQRCLGNVPQLIDGLNTALDNTDLSVTHVSMGGNLELGQSSVDRLTQTIKDQSIQTAIPKPFAKPDQFNLPVKLTGSLPPPQQFVDMGVSSPQFGGPAITLPPNLTQPQQSNYGLSIDRNNPSPADSPICANIQAVGWQQVLSDYQATQSQGGFTIGFIDGGLDSLGKRIALAVAIVSAHQNYSTCSLDVVISTTGGGLGQGGQGICSIPMPNCTNTQTQTQQTQQTQSTCPPPVINVNCGTCKPDETKPPPPKPCKYDIYCTADNVIYIVRSDQPPRSDSDTKLASGDVAEIDLNSLIGKCQSKEQQQQQEQPFQGQIWLPVNNQFSGCENFGPIPGVVPDNRQINLSQILGFRDDAGAIHTPFPDAGLTDFPEKIFNFGIQFGATILDQLSSIMSPLISQSPCGTGQNFALQATNIVLGVIEKWAGGALDFVKIPNDYQRHFVCPQEIPGLAQAVSAFLGGQIDENTLECWIRANNGKYPEFKPVVDSQRSKLSADQFAIALRRGLVNQQMYDTYIRESGYLRNFEPKLIYDLTAQIPPPSDIVRMMVRDAEDTVNIDWQTSDKIFRDKYAGQLQKWGEQQGIDSTYMKYLWRSHWSLPSPGQLYEMLHRLSRLPANDPAYVDNKIIRQTLLQQDIHPDWVDRFIAISYNPLTRIDSRRAYEIGALTKDELKEAYLNLGYNSEDADTLVEFNDRNVRRTFLRRPEVKQLAAGELSYSEFQETMKMFGASDYAIEDATKYANLIRKKETRKSCVKGIKKRYMTGAIKASEANSELVDFGVDPIVATGLVDGWQCERTSKGKVLTAAQVISLYQDSLIDEMELYRRLLNIGYNEDDAMTMVRQQSQRKGIKIQKDELAQMRRAQQEQARLARQIQQAARRKESAQRRVDNEARRARQVSEAREKRLLEAGFKFSKLAQLKPEEGAMKVKALYNAILSEYPATRDEVIAALLLAAQTSTVNTEDLLRSAVLKGLQSVGYIPPDPPTLSEITDRQEAL